MSYGRGDLDDEQRDDAEVGRPMDSVGQVIEWNGPDRTLFGTVAGAAIIELDLPARVDLVAVARMVIAAAASCATVLDGDRLDDLRLLTSEATTNAVEATLATERPGRIWIEAALEADGLTLSVSDEGSGLSDLGAVLSGWTEFPNLGDPEGLRHEGGFGLPLMHLLSSQPVQFLSGEQGTTVRLHLAQEKPRAS